MRSSHVIINLLLAILVLLQCDDRSATAFQQQSCSPPFFLPRTRRRPNEREASRVPAAAAVSPRRESPTQRTNNRPPRRLWAKPAEEENNSITDPTEAAASPSSPLSSSPVESSSSSTLLLLEPDSLESRHLVVNALGLSETQFGQLVQLSHLICEWNDRINLVSRKDCTPALVWTRHVLPSVAAYGITKVATTGQNPLSTAQSVVDVGTGGGFPGLPLAISYPNAQFVLLDSVGKKLMAVRDMAQRLGLNNVETHHGRAEEYRPPNGRRFDVATGRSVSNVPQFCSWMHHLVGGHLLYWIGDSSTALGGEEASAGKIGGKIGGGGGIPANVVAECTHMAMVESLLHNAISTDKRILVIEREGVQRLARQKPFDNNAPGTAAVRSSPHRRSAAGNHNNEPQKPSRRRPQGVAPSRSTAAAPTTFRAASRATWQRPAVRTMTTNDPDGGGASSDRFRRYDSRDAPSPR